MTTWITDLLVTLALTARLAVRNRLSRRRVTGDGGATVSLTTYGRRTRSVHLTIESIAAGQVRPSRIVLWLDDAGTVTRPHAALRRLVRRGLELRSTADLGPHKKYYPAVCETIDGPLVTVDDDVLYPNQWLRMLLDTHSEFPEAVLAHRVNRITVGGGSIRPYVEWGRAADHSPTPRNFATGVKGVLYPERMQRLLREAGDGFLEHARSADDIWLHHVALRNGIQVLPVLGLPMNAVRAIRGVRGGSALADENVSGGGNDRVVAAVYTGEEIAAIVHDDWSMVAMSGERV